LILAQREWTELRLQVSDDVEIQSGGWHSGKESRKALFLRPQFFFFYIIMWVTFPGWMKSLGLQ
jgi:hypothetical protein